MKIVRLLPAMSAVILFLLTIPSLSEAKHALWKVSSDDSGTLYLQGSVHVLKAENHPLPSAIEAAYSNSTALVLEVDMAEMTSPETQQLLMKKGLLKQPDTLKSVLSTESYAALEKACTEAGLPMMTIQHFKPWFAAMMLSVVKMQQLGLNAQYGIDTYFFSKAQADKKPIIGLETVAFQINLFDALAEQNPNDFIDRSLSDLELLEEEINTILDAWENGELDRLEKLLLKSFDEYPELYERFITARNITWAESLSTLLAEGKTFMVVVGAGHLPGESGLINLLKQKGFEVEQL